jgi:hypothetical protein
MNDDLHAIPTTKTTLEFIRDVDIIMGFTYILPMLEVVHEFIKIVQSHDAFICDFMKVVNMCCAIFYSIYCDPKKKYFNL